MRLHIFVATTQGLVAVQKIYEQDPEIGSVVSVNGTATISPITQAYRSFVNKGVGIIETDFGLPSYRVNIGGQIDQGNSWQLGFYLAHAAYAQGILGNGDVADGDLVLCATGEINTSERKVLTVEQVPLKISKANHTATSWPDAATRFFIIPADNEIDTADADPILPIRFVCSLDDALAFLPVQAASVQNSNDQKIVIAAPATTALVTPLASTAAGWHGRKIIAALSLFAVLAALAAYQQGFFDGHLLGNIVGAEVIETPAIKAHVRDSAQDKNITAEEPNVSSDKAAGDVAQMVLTYGTDGQCANDKATDEILVAQENVFEPSKQTGLCKIKLSGLEAFSSVIAVNKRSHRFVVASKLNDLFVLPVPSTTVEYMMIAIKNPINEQSKKQLWSYFFNLPDRLVLSPKDIDKIPFIEFGTYQIYSHSFVKN